jgi:hypothetical protein
MAKPKKGHGGSAELEFPRTGNPWIDAGIVGLYRILDGRAPYVDPPEGNVDVEIPEGVTYRLDHDRLTVSGPGARVQALLEQAYDRLVATYFNVSSKKQKEDRANYNFYFNSSDGMFHAFAKKKAAGAASLLFDKAARPSGTQVAWGTGAGGKKEPGRLPPSHAHLQRLLDEFLALEKLKPGPPAGLLIDGPNQVRPKVEIRVDATEAKATCFLVGDPAPVGVEAKETAFPLLGGSRAFVNGTANWPRLGWKVDLIGKFVPVVTFFYLQGDDLHLFLPQSNDLRRINQVAESLLRMVYLEPNLFRNFNFADKLGGYFSRRSEVVTAFLHRVFVELTSQKQANQAQRAELQAPKDDMEPLFDEEPILPDTEPPISFREVYEATQVGGPVSFAIVSAVKKGNVWMARDFWTFQDVVYLARLFERMQQPLQTRVGGVKPLCPPGVFLRTLVDHEANDESRTLLRDQVCEAILRRQPVLHLLERHAFHSNTHSDPGRSRPVYPLLAFAKLYEIELRRETSMEETYPTMVKTATWLGDTIGKAVADAVRDKEQNESRGQARGALFRLRKTRSTSDFMNELARLQFRYNIDVPRDVLDAQVFNRETFEEFRGFCVVAALSRYLYATGETKTKTPTPSGKD